MLLGEYHRDDFEQANMLELVDKEYKLNHSKHKHSISFMLTHCFLIPLIIIEFVLVNNARI